MTICKDLSEFNLIQCEEINKYIWIKGIEIGHDPRLDQSENELAMEWIVQFRQQYRDTHIIINK